MLQRLLCEPLTVQDCVQLQLPRAYFNRLPNFYNGNAKLILVFRGALVFTLDDVPYPLTARTMLYRPAMTHSDWRMTTAATFGYIEFQPAPGTMLPATPLRQTLNAADWAIERAAFDRVRRHSATPRAAALADGELKAMLVRFLHAADPSPARGDLSLADRAAELLNQQFDRADIIATLPDRLNASPTAIRRVFRKRFETTAVAYLNNLRMRQARQLLIQTSMPLKQIARRVGLADPFYFSRAYRRHFGHPPSQDRAEKSMPKPA